MLKLAFYKPTMPSSRPQVYFLHLEASFPAREYPAIPGSAVGVNIEETVQSLRTRTTSSGAPSLRTCPSALKARSDSWCPRTIKPQLHPRLLKLGPGEWSQFDLTLLLGCGRSLRSIQTRLSTYFLAAYDGVETERLERWSCAADCDVQGVRRGGYRCEVRDRRLVGKRILQSLATIADKSRLWLLRRFSSLPK